MLKSVRQTRIRQLVESQGHVTVQELNELLDVSVATIRRDLDELSQVGWVHRTHGGAVKVERVGREPAIGLRRGEYAVEKERIGRLAASLVEPGQSIFLGSGSTVHEIAHNLASVTNLTIITNALNVVNELAGREDIELVVIGGLLRQSEQSMVGHIAVDAIREFRADTAFMGMRGIDPLHGFTGDYMLETVTDRTIMHIAPQVVIVADHSKLGKVSTVFLAPISAAHILITDEGARAESVEALRAAGLDVRLA